MNLQLTIAEHKMNSRDFKIHIVSLREAKRGQRMFLFVVKGNRYTMITISSVTCAQRTRGVRRIISLDESIANMPYFCQANALDPLISDNPKTIFTVFR